MPSQPPPASWMPTTASVASRRRRQRPLRDGHLPPPWASARATSSATSTSYPWHSRRRASRARARAAAAQRAPSVVGGASAARRQRLLGLRVGWRRARRLVAGAPRGLWPAASAPLTPTRGEAGVSPPRSRDQRLGAPDLLNLIHCDPACMGWLAPGNRHHSAQVRFRILDSVCRYLTTTARGSGSVVVIEDLHWADAGSLLLFDQLLHSLGQAPIMLVGTLRPVALGAGHPNSESLRGMLKSGTVESLLLSPLSPPAIAGLEVSLSQLPAS